jgi:hypothetical protein
LAGARIRPAALCKRRARASLSVKAKKKKLALPRRRWQINPVTRVTPSRRAYSRPRAKQDLHKDDEQ